MGTPEYVGERFRRRRVERKLSLEAVGEACNPRMTRAQVSKLELGAPRVTLDQYRGVGRVVGLPFWKVLRDLDRAGPWLTSSRL